MLDKIEGFDWDAANVGHILRHAVTPIEVEEVVGRTHMIIPAKSVNGENRWKLFRQNSIRPLPGCGLHYPPEAVPRRHRLRNERYR